MNQEYLFHVLIQVEALESLIRIIKKKKPLLNIVQYYINYYYFVHTIPTIRFCFKTIIVS